MRRSNKSGGGVFTTARGNCKLPATATAHGHEISMLSRRTLCVSSAAAAVTTFAGPRTGFGANADENSAPQTVLHLERRSIEVNGKQASVYAISQPNGASGIGTRAGTQFRVRVENRINEPSLIHWHGLTPPWQQDGVPGISGPPIPAGESVAYDFPLRSGGTFWMHSHQGLQEQSLMTAPLIIHDQRDRPDHQEVIVMLADFSFTPPEEIYAALKKGNAMSAMAGASPSSSSGMQPSKGAGMRMAAAGPDLNDVKYDAFLANRRTLGDPEVVNVEPGGRVLLRVINSSSMSAFHLDLGELEGELVAVDGFEIEPVAGKRFPIAVAQRLDVRLGIPRAAAAYPVLAVLEGENRQTGIVLRAGNASITRFPDTTTMASSALTLDLERRLRAKAPLAPRRADRRHTLNLTGDMAGYSWSINNIAWTKETPPLPVVKGDRVELLFVNQTPMPHPMHLHGHEFQVVEINDQRFSGAVRDTVLVPPGHRVMVAFDADNPGLWALHCHLLYHLEAGMFTTLRYV
jgi:FtsP/CotA-like multicopper oxidase with cupredoxin domain